MKIDIYTKSILTVIAICLVIIVVKDLEIMPKAQAGAGTTAYLNTQGLSINEDGSLNVVISAVDPSSTMDVNISRISTSDEMEVQIEDINSSRVMKVNLVDINTDDELDINIDEVGGRYLSSGGPILVEIDE